MAPLYRPDHEIIGVVLTLQDDTLSRSWSAWSDLGPGVEPDAVLEHLDRGVFVVNDRWRITAFNRRAQEITGYTQDEAVGPLCWEIFQADHCKRGCFLRATLEDGATRRKQNVRIRTKKGESLDLLVSTSPIKSKREAIVGGVETFQSLGLALMEKEEAPAIPGEVEVIGASPVMKRLLAMLPDVAASEATVILEGESGTGKDLFAQAIHLHSPRAKGPFVAFSCSALVESLIESELFGHVRGAFTGAVSHKVGRFELARGGTLFLDEYRGSETRNPGQTSSGPGNQSLRAGGEHHHHSPGGPADCCHQPQSGPGGAPGPLSAWTSSTACAPCLLLSPLCGSAKRISPSW